MKWRMTASPPGGLFATPEKYDDSDSPEDTNRVSTRMSVVGTLHHFLSFFRIYFFSGHALSLDAHLMVGLLSCS